MPFISPSVLTFWSLVRVWRVGGSAVRRRLEITRATEITLHERKMQPCLEAPKPAIAQLVEHLTVDSCSNQMVPGSIPGGRIYARRPIA